MEKLTEKRTSTRESGLRELCAGLRSYAFAEQALGNRETAVGSVLGLVKRAGPTEGVLCCEALGLLLLLLGPEEDEVFGQVVAPLEFVITRSRYEDVRVEAVQALALGCFICSSEEEATVRALRLLYDVFTGNSEGAPATDELKAAALDGWALLATTAPRSYHTAQLRSRLWGELLGLLGSPCAELRVSAGEALALLVEHWREEQGVAEGGALELPADEEAALDEGIDRLQELAKEGSKRMSRRDKKAQRASFREVYAAVALGEPPEEVLAFRTQTFRLTSWAKLKQLEALKDCLQGGFLVGFARNPVIHEIFGIDADAFDMPLERAVVQKNSELGKARTTARTRNRKSRENAKTAFLDDEDG